jgi:hypothetical protein
MPHCLAGRAAREKLGSIMEREKTTTSKDFTDEINQAQT